MHCGIYASGLHVYWLIRVKSFAPIWAPDCANALSGIIRVYNACAFSCHRDLALMKSKIQTIAVKRQH